MMGSAKPQAGMLTVGQAAQLLEVTPRQIQLLVDKGHIKRASRGQYPLIGVVRGYLRYLLFELYSDQTEGMIPILRREMIECEIERRSEARARALMRERSRNG